MAIEAEDYALLAEYRAKFPEGDSCAILGDVTVHDPTQEHEAGGAERLKDLGFDRIDTFDILGTPTHRVNLNEQLDEKFHNQYDWVIDSGTLYCCFNLSTVFKNILYILKDKGCCFHTSNLCGWYGRGFYSTSPSLYQEFYRVNNFNIEGMGTKTRSGPKKWFPIDTHATYLEYANHSRLFFAEEPQNFCQTLPNDSLLHCFVSRTERSEFKEPVPEHYVLHEKK